MVPPLMDPGLVRLTCIFQCLMLLFASWICVNIGGGSYMYMIRMHAYRCDKSNDISICNLKTFKHSGLGFKIQDSQKIFSHILES